MANVKPITAEEVHKIENESGAEQAYNILLLYGADCFDGNYNDYNRILADLDSKQSECRYCLRSAEKFSKNFAEKY